MPQRSIPAVYMRGGTSKGIFLDEGLLPAPGPERDALLLEIMGSPDPMQIDGMGGTVSSTSKVMAVSRSERDDADVDYLFIQVGIDRPVVSYRGNCGNLTAGVAAYAVDEGLVDDVNGPVATVVMFNKNTGVRVRAHVPIEDGRAAVQGDHLIAGVPTPGAMITNEYLDPAGAVFGKLLPTGQTLDLLEVDGRNIEMSVVDAANPLMFLRAGDVGLDGGELPEDINSRPEVLERIERIRGACAVRLGLCERPEDAAQSTPVLPFPVIVSPPADTRTADGEDSRAVDMTLRARAFSLQRMHHAYPGTALICTSAAAAIPGTIPNEVARLDGPEIRIAHPKGIAAAVTDIDLGGDGPRVISVSITRTARRLMRGELFVRS